MSFVNVNTPQKYVNVTLNNSLMEDCAPGTGVPEFRSIFWNAGGLSILFERISKGTGAQAKICVPFCLPDFRNTQWITFECGTLVVMPSMLGL